MIWRTFILPLLFATPTVIAQNQTRDGCPKDEYACLDVINSSQCLEQLVIEKLAPATPEALANCVEYEGTVTRIPGGTKVRPNKNFKLSVAKRDKLTCIVYSSVGVQDVIPPKSTLRSPKRSHLHVHNDEAHRLHNLN